MITRRSFALSIVSLLPLASTMSSIARAQKKGGHEEDDSAARAARQLFLAVREGRDAAALRLFHDEEQGRFLFDAEWTKQTFAARDEFTKLVQSLFAKIAFARARENLKNLDSVTYDPATLAGDEAMVGSTIFLKHPLKTQEMKVRYVFRKDAPGWRLFDFSVLGSSAMTDIRDDQIRPLLKEGGWNRVMERLREENAAATKAASKAG